MKVFIIIFISVIALLSVSVAYANTRGNDRFENHINNDLSDQTSHDLYYLSLQVPLPIYYDWKSGKMPTNLGIIIIDKYYYINNGEPYFNVRSNLRWDVWGRNGNEATYIRLAYNGNYNITQSMLNGNLSNYSWVIQSR